MSEGPETGAGAWRVERDSMGEMRVPAGALYGASTARAVENFPISGRPLPPPLIHALGELKAACARANQILGRLDAERAEAIAEAALEVAAGRHDRHFPVDVFQTGSGTSTHMNANEVIAHLASARLGRQGSVHPNDHVNRGQSSNDIFPTAMQIAAVLEIERRLLPSLAVLEQELAARAAEWDDLVKVGRTHLMDATPIRVGQVFSGYAAQVRRAAGGLRSAARELATSLPVGGTAVGTGQNTHPRFGEVVSQDLSERLGVHFAETDNHPALQASRDVLVAAHGALRVTALALSKIANDLRHLASGPRCGLSELRLPAVQPGSSIMPGKVNPVICESVVQVACRVLGNDAVVVAADLGGVGSIFELNVAMPVMADAFLESTAILASVSRVFAEKALRGLEVDAARCREFAERSLMLVTALTPEIGYDRAAEIAKRALAEGRTLREVCLEEGVLPAERLDEILDPMRMTRPG